MVDCSKDVIVNRDGKLPQLSIVLPALNDGYTITHLADMVNTGKAF